MAKGEEDELLRSVALQNAKSILTARQRAEQEIVQAKEALRESAERLQLALAAGHLGDWSWDAATDLVQLGPRAAEIFGVPPGEPLTRAGLRKLLPEEDAERARVAMEQALKVRGDYSIEYRINHATRAQRWVAARGLGTYSAEGQVRGMIGVVSDITERKTADDDNARLYEAAQNAAEERKQLLENERSARADAERANTIKDDFLATLSHELRTPLNSILGWSQILKRGVSPDDVQRGLDAIERNARVQAQLIEDLLDMSRIASGKTRLEIQPVEPVRIIEAAIETVSPAAETKRIRIEKLLDPAAGPIYGDPSRLQQIVWNLLSNAIKFTPKDGKVQVLLERVNSHIEISVADTGIGIKEEFLPFVFDRFRQADPSTTRSYGGLGLGMSIVRHLVELHGGTVHVKSAGDGQGSTFAVHLPLTVVQLQAHSGDRAHPKTPMTVTTNFRLTDLSGLRILVVDDEADARELLKHVLTDCHAQVFAASTAAEAVLVVEKERPHVLVSDVGLPHVDGYELLSRVRALGAARGGNLPAIALTAFARSEDRTRALRAGYLVHVSKPVEPAELVATVASVSGRSGG